MIRTKLTPLGRFVELEITVSIPCRHGWRSVHCDRDDEGSHPGAVEPSDECYCGEATTIFIRPFGRLGDYLDRLAIRGLDPDLTILDELTGKQP